MSDYTIELIKEPQAMERLADRLLSKPVIALDIETINWWNRRMERVSLIQLAFRTEGQPKVAIIDALSEKLELEPLRNPLENAAITKVIHNAVFDASRLDTHFKFKVAPVFDTMAAARRSGERRYSLQAQAKTYLGLHLDKNWQRSDWSRRPLDSRQLYYAAQDAFVALLLYENQKERKLNGLFQLKSALLAQQEELPLLEDLSARSVFEKKEKSFEALAEEKRAQPETDLSSSSLAILGIISELPNRYHPDQLAVSVGSERVGLAGWIVDHILGTDADFDEESAKIAIADLCERQMVRITPTRRLEATTEGEGLWRELKSF